MATAYSPTTQALSGRRQQTRERGAADVFAKPRLRLGWAALLQALTADPLVAAIAASSRQTRGVIDTSVSSGAVGPSRLPVGQLAVSPEYFDVLGIDVVSGRGFTHAERTAEAGVVVVSEPIARQLWPNGNGVGQVVRLEAPPSASPGTPSLPSRTSTVVGVVRGPSGSTSVGTVYLPTGPESPETSLYLRVRGNPEQARQALLERLTSADYGLTELMSQLPKSSRTASLTTLGIE